MNPKELIVKIKEYASFADATYAMLHYPKTRNQDEKFSRQLH